MTSPPSCDPAHSIAVVNAAVRRVLRRKARSPVHRSLSRCQRERERCSCWRPRIGTSPGVSPRKAIVLLKNERHLLPLDTTAGTIAVIGPLADDRPTPSPLSGQGDRATCRAARGAQGPARRRRREHRLRQGLRHHHTATAGFAEAVAAARQARVAFWAREAAGIAAKRRAAPTSPARVQESCSRRAATGTPSCSSS